MTLKKILYTALLLVSALAYSQNDTIAEQRDETGGQRNFRFNANLRSALVRPIGVGDNYLGKGNSGIIGHSLKFNFFELCNFHVGAGYSMLFHSITDGSLGGNMNTTNIYDLYLEVMYEVPVTNKITLFPKISGGPAAIHHGGKSRYGGQYGPRFGIGTYADYKLKKWLEVFIGVDYVMLFPKVETAPEYRSFFGELKQVTVSVGLKFNMKD